jgi:hypothetical protein
MVEVASISNIRRAACTLVAEGKVLWLQHLLEISSFHNSLNDSHSLNNSHRSSNLKCKTIVC